MHKILLEISIRYAKKTYTTARRTVTSVFVSRIFHEIEFFIDRSREKFRLETAILGTGFLRMSKKNL